MQKTERAPEGARPPYTCVTLERIADADGEVFRIGAGSERLRAIVVVRRRDAVPQERADPVKERLPIEAPARTHGPQRGPQAGGAAGARRELAFALAGFNELGRKAPRSEAAVPADPVGGVLVIRDFRRRRRGDLAGFVVLELRHVKHE